jgi:phage gpG-like protein
MASFIEINSRPVSAVLTALRDKLGDVSPFLKAVGEDIVERIKGRFASGAAPDGSRWAPNSQVTLIRYLQQRGGFSEKTGKILAKGRALAISKRPLQGQSGDLARQNHYLIVGGQELVVSNSMVYAAMQHFGGTKAQFPHLWGNIPARPFMPITPAGELYPGEQDAIVEGLRQYLNPA